MVRRERRLRSGFGVCRRTGRGIHRPVEVAVFLALRVDDDRPGTGGDAGRGGGGIGHGSQQHGRGVLLALEERAGEKDDHGRKPDDPEQDTEFLEPSDSGWGRVRGWRRRRRKSRSYGRCGNGRRNGRRLGYVDRDHGRDVDHGVGTTRDRGVGSHRGAGRNQNRSHHLNIHPETSHELRRTTRDPLTVNLHFVTPRQRETCRGFEDETLLASSLRSGGNVAHEPPIEGDEVGRSLWGDLVQIPVLDFGRRDDEGELEGLALNRPHRSCQLSVLIQKFHGVLQ